MKWVFKSFSKFINVSTSSPYCVKKLLICALVWGGAHSSFHFCSPASVFHFQERILYASQAKLANISSVIIQQIAKRRITAPKSTASAVILFNTTARCSRPRLTKSKPFVIYPKTSFGVQLDTLICSPLFYAWAVSTIITGEVAASSDFATGIKNYSRKPSTQGQFQYRFFS